MKPVLTSLGMAPYLVSIRALALLLPRRERAEWTREWTSELWYVYQDSVRASFREWLDSPSDLLHGHRSVAAFCYGAFHDARSLKQSDSLPVRSSVPRARSATRCLGDPCLHGNPKRSLRSLYSQHAGLAGIISV